MWHLPQTERRVLIKHGEVTKDIASIAIWDIDPATLPEKEMEETNWELLSDEEMEALFINNQTN